MSTQDTAEQECMKALQCLYLEVDASIADDVKRKVLAALKEAKSPSTLPVQLDNDYGATINTDFIDFIIYLTGYKTEQAIKIYQNWNRNIKIHKS